jgi:hypothetical protein
MVPKDGDVRERKSPQLGPPKLMIANDGFWGLPRPYVASARICGIWILDNRSRMRFLDSAPWGRVSRREIAVELGPQTKVVVFFSVAIGTPSSARSAQSEFWDFGAKLVHKGGNAKRTPQRPRHRHGPPATSPGRKPWFATSSLEKLRQFLLMVLLLMDARTCAVRHRADRGDRCQGLRRRFCRPGVSVPSTRAFSSV